MNLWGIAAVLLMDKERRQDFQAVLRTVLDCFDQEHVGLLALLGIDKLDPLGGEVVGLHGLDNVQKTVRTVDHGQAAIGLEDPLGNSTDLLQIGRNLVAGQEIMLAAIEIGMLINLKIRRIAEDDVHLGAADIAAQIFKIIGDDLHLLVQVIELDGALGHVSQAFLDLHSYNLGLGPGAGKKADSSIACAEVDDQAPLGQAGKAGQEDTVDRVAEDLAVLDDFNIGGKELVDPFPIFQDWIFHVTIIARLAAIQKGERKIL